MFGGNRESRFKFNLPKGWEDQSVYHIKGPTENGVDHMLMLTVDRNRQEDDLERYALARTRSIISSMPGAEVLKDEEITVPGGNPVYEFTFKWRPSDENTYLEKYFFVFHDNMGLTFYLRFEKNTHKTVGLQLKEVIESILPGTFNPGSDQ